MIIGSARASVLLCLLMFFAPAPGNAASGPKIQVVTSAKGITAWMVEDHKVPVLALRFFMPGGGALDPPDKQGLTRMVSSLIDEGAGDLDSQAFQGRLDDLAISLRFNSGRDSFGGRLRTLSENRDEAFRLLGLALTVPRFDAEPVARIRGQILAMLRRDSEDPGSIASRSWFKTAFPSHPYGAANDGTEATVKAITTADLRAFAKQRFTRQGLLIAVVGDITAAELAQRLDQAFGELPNHRVLVPAVQVSPAGGGTLKVVQLKVPQSQIMFGGPGLARKDPDWYVAYVLNYLVGGGSFVSRLYQEVREKRGLAYSIYSYLYPLDQTALFMGGVGTQNSRVKETLDTVRQSLDTILEQGFSAEELRNAKTYINGSFPLQFTSSSRIAGILLAMQRHSLGLDYLERRADFINAVSLEDLGRIAKRLLKPENFLTVVVGNPTGLAVAAKAKAGR